MDTRTKEEMAGRVQGFRLPRYEQIPDVGLQYISRSLEPLGSISITGSMVSNYVKKGLVDNPVKKQYSRDQVAYLLFIAVAKTVLSMEDIRLLIRLQKATYTSQRAYDYFCRELENLICYVFGLKAAPDRVGEEHTDEKLLLRAAIITVAHKVYLDACFEKLHGQ